MKLLKQARELIACIEDGCMSSTAYDTSWFLRLENRNGNLHFPAVYRWLISHQHSDGSWGGTFETFHDRIISTIACVIALHRFNCVENTPLIARGIEYIHKNAHKLKDDKFETIGFELLFPMLLDESAKLGLCMPFDEFDFIRSKAVEKMQKIPRGWMYEKESPVVHNLEFMAEHVEPDKLISLLEVNGSIGNSPSASAYAAQFVDHPALETYLSRIMKHSIDGGACNVQPFEIFEISWIYYNLLLAGIHLEEMRHGIAYIRRWWRSNGIGISRGGLMPDSDDSSVASRVMSMWGEPIDTRFLDYYESDFGYVTFPYERNASVSTNIHILDVLQHSSSEQTSLKKNAVLDFLHAVRSDNRYWKDKWHVSPYYPTSHAIIALRNLNTRLTEDAAQWILETQNSDGSWGIFQGTMEETSYCVQALILIGSYEKPSVNKL